MIIIRIKLAKQYNYEMIKMMWQLSIAGLEMFLLVFLLCFSFSSLFCFVLFESIFLFFFLSLFLSLSSLKFESVWLWLRWGATASIQSRIVLWHEKMLIQTDLPDDFAPVVGVEDVGHNRVDRLQQLMKMGRAEVIDGVGRTERQVRDVGRHRRPFTGHFDVFIEK